MYQPNRLGRKIFELGYEKYSKLRIFPPYPPTLRIQILKGIENEQHKAHRVRQTAALQQTTTTAQQQERGREELQLGTEID